MPVLIGPVCLPRLHLQVRMNNRKPPASLPEIYCHTSSSAWSKQDLPEASKLWQQGASSGAHVTCAPVSACSLRTAHPACQETVGVPVHANYTFYPPLRSWQMSCGCWVLGSTASRPSEWSNLLAPCPGGQPWVYPIERLRCKRPFAHYQRIKIKHNSTISTCAMETGNLSPDEPLGVSSAASWGRTHLLSSEIRFGHVWSNGRTTSELVQHVYAPLLPGTCFVATTSHLCGFKAADLPRLHLVFAGLCHKASTSALVALHPVARPLAAHPKVLCTHLMVPVAPTGWMRIDSLTTALKYGRVRSAQSRGRAGGRPCTCSVRTHLHVVPYSKSCITLRYLLSTATNMFLLHSMLWWQCWMFIVGAHYQWIIFRDWRLQIANCKLCYKFSDIMHAKFETRKLPSGPKS